MRDTNEQYAYFTIVGEFDPEEITKRAGVEPTRSWRKGDLTDGGRERTFSRWSLHSRLEKSTALEDHIRDVIAQLDSNAAAFQAISAEHEGTLEVVGYFFAQYPGFGLDRGMVQALARYGLEVDCDFYGLYSHRLNDTEA